jgi:hypothetical protein
MIAPHYTNCTIGVSVRSWAPLADAPNGDSRGRTRKRVRAFIAARRIVGKCEFFGYGRAGFCFTFG